MRKNSPWCAESEFSQHKFFRKPTILNHINAMPYIAALLRLRVRMCFQVRFCVNLHSRLYTSTYVRCDLQRCENPLTTWRVRPRPYSERRRLFVILGEFMLVTRCRTFSAVRSRPILWSMIGITLCVCKCGFARCHRRESKPTKYRAPTFQNGESKRRIFFF